MKVTEKWLREWANPKQNAVAIADILSMSGLEVESLHPFHDDHLFDISITPNRSDCLSIKGIAREISALTQCAFTPLQIVNNKVTHQEQLPITLQSPDCPIYQGRIIQGVDNTKPTPAFIQERLETLGVRSISLIVDIANYVMMELGQPLHAFDLDKIDGEIIVRDAKAGESLVLLDDTRALLDERTLIIADKHKPLALAGVMGGLESGVTLETKTIFLESAFFNPKRIAGKTRLFGINSDAAYRFERGVDFNLTKDALERVTQLILQYAGGEAGPITTAGKHPEGHGPIVLRPARINKILGMDFPQDEVLPILERLGMQVAHDWQVTPPSYRFDISLEIDVIEELARVYGYQHIPATIPHTALLAIPSHESHLPDSQLRDTLVARGFTELITYSFVPDTLQQQILGSMAALKLLNPMSNQMDVMRRSLIPGLLQAFCYNQNRQIAAMRLFELGLCFIPSEGELKQIQHIAGILSSQQEKNWQFPKREANFYDIKGDVEALLALTGNDQEFIWRVGKHPAFHSGQCAEVLRDGVSVGFVGQLHPKITKSLDIKGKVFVFELQLDLIVSAKFPQYQALSKFPSVRRDLAIVVDRNRPAQDLCDIVKKEASTLLQDIQIFDVYEGEGIAPGKKSVAMGIVFQSTTETLQDQAVNALIEKIIRALEQKFEATIRV